MRIVDNLPEEQGRGSGFRICSQIVNCGAVEARVTNEKNVMEHAIRKPVESRHAYRHRRTTLALATALALGIALALTVLLVG
jgi:hypothetical protein